MRHDYATFSVFYHLLRDSLHGREYAGQTTAKGLQRRSGHAFRPRREDEYVRSSEIIIHPIRHSREDHSTLKGLPHHSLGLLGELHKMTLDLIESVRPDNDKNGLRFPLGDFPPRLEQNIDAFSDHHRPDKADERFAPRKVELCSYRFFVVRRGIARRVDAFCQPPKLVLRQTYALVACREGLGDGEVPVEEPEEAHLDRGQRAVLRDALGIIGPHQSHLEDRLLAEDSREQHRGVSADGDAVNVQYIKIILELQHHEGRSYVEYDRAELPRQQWRDPIYPDPVDDLVCRQTLEAVAYDEEIHALLFQPAPDPLDLDGLPAEDRCVPHYEKADLHLFPL